jgi:hypothetical protein
MLRSYCRLTHRNVLTSAEAPRTHLVAIAFLFLLVIPKTAEQTLEQGYPTFFSNLSSHPLMPISCSISASWCFHNSRS